MDAGSFFLGALAGGVVTYAGALIAALRRLHRQAAQQQSGGGPTWPNPLDPAAWPTPQQQEASNQRSDEAMGSLGNVPSNVVSPKGWSNEGWRAWEVTPPPSEREVEIRRGNGPITRIIPCQQNPAWNIANVYWRGVSKEG